MIPLDPSDRVLVQMPSWLGDFVAAEPLCAALDAWLEGASGASRASSAGRLGIAGPARFLELFDGRFERALRVPLAARAALPRDLGADWDVALLLGGSLRSAWGAWRAGLARRVGWARGGRRLCLTDSMAPARELGRAPLGLGRAGRLPRYLPRPFGTAAAELASALGVPVRRRRPRLSAAGPARERAALGLARLGLAGRPFVLANVAGRAQSAKAVPAAIWARELARLADPGAGAPLAVVCASAPGEERALEALRAHFAGGALPCFAWEPAPELAELAALCERAALVVTADSGPRHVASAVGTPVVAAFGPTDPRHTSDVPSAVPPVRHMVPCGPCHAERCPLFGERALACWHALEPGALAAAVRAAWAARERAAPARGLP